MNNAQLETLKNWVETHGNRAYIRGDAVVIESLAVSREGAVYTERLIARDVSQARNILGY